MIGRQNVKASDKHAETSRKGWSSYDAQRAYHDGHEEEIDEARVVKVCGDGSWMDEYAEKEEDDGNGQYSTRHEIQSEPYFLWDFKHAEVLRCGLPHGGEGEEGERNCIVRDVPLDNPAAPRRYLGKVELFLGHVSLLLDNDGVAAVRSAGRGKGEGDGWRRRSAGLRGWTVEGDCQD